MASLTIRIFPDPALRCRSRVADWRDPALHRILQDLVETLHHQPGGVGIAGCQVGVGLRLAVIDLSAKDPTKKIEILINPVIRRMAGQILSREGCMSLPDYTANIKRAQTVVAEWTDEHGSRRRETLEGISAICFQHEVDHLNGVLIIDRVVSLKTEVFPRARRA